MSLADEECTSLVVCDRCEKVRSVKGEVPDGRWTCCNQPWAAVAAEEVDFHAVQSKGKGKEPEAVVDKKGKGVDVGDGASAPTLERGSGTALVFKCVSCAQPRLLPDGLREVSVSQCCDIPDAQLASLCGGVRIASQLLQAGIATQGQLAALDVDGEVGTELLRVASVARVNVDELVEWVAQARSLELDEVMHDLLAPPHPELTCWDVKLVFSRLEERAGVSTPADLAAAPIETTLLPALHGLNLTARDLVLMRAKAETRLAESPPWMALAKSSFPALTSGYGDKLGGAATGEGGWDPAPAPDTVDVELLRAALQTIKEHADISQAGESVRYLYRISCNVVDSPEELRYRRLRVDNRAYVAHVLGVRGACLGMEALGWRESPDGSLCVLPKDARITSETTDVILECMKGLIARAALQTTAVQEKGTGAQ